jgi:hypothetical protein
MRSVADGHMHEIVRYSGISFTRLAQCVPPRMLFPAATGPRMVSHAQLAQDESGTAWSLWRSFTCMHLF